MSGNKKIARIIQILLFAVGIFLCYQFFHSINFDEVKDYINQGEKWPILLVFVVSLLVYVFRVLRWHLLLEAADERNNNVYASFSALSISYLISFFLPRVGELGRCILINRYRKTPIAKSVGTVIVERITDIVALFLILGLCLVMVNHKITQFFQENIFGPIKHIFQQASITSLIWIALLMLIFLAITVRYILPFLKNKFTKIFLETKEGLHSITHLQSPALYIGYTLGIWCCYFLMTWLWFLMFTETQSLPFTEVFFIFVIGTIGRSIPINGGGAGAYHFLVLQAFLLCNVSESVGKSMALIIHGGQTVFTLIAAIIGLPYILWSAKNN